MIETSRLILFLAASITLLLIPGPAVLYVVTRSMSQGKRGGFISTLGLAAGNLAHVAAAALGLSALLVASAYAFTTVKWLGACYLIFLGTRTIFQKKSVSKTLKGIEVRSSDIFLQGVVVNVLNPKSALFFFAFLPQFVSPAAGPVALQMLALGMIFLFLGVFTDSLYVILASQIRNYLQRHPGFMARQKYFTGAIYIALGIGTAGTDGSSAGNSK